MAAFNHRLVSRVEEKAGPSSYESLRTITSLFLAAAFNKGERRRGLSARRFATPRGENTWSILVREGGGEGTKGWLNDGRAGIREKRVELFDNWQRRATR